MHFAEYSLVMSEIGLEKDVWSRCWMEVKLVGEEGTTWLTLFCQLPVGALTLFTAARILSELHQLWRGGFSILKECFNRENN